MGILTEDEIRGVLSFLADYYPNSFTNTTARGSEMMLKVWGRAFAAEDARLVNEAVMQCVLESKDNFAPQIGVIREKMIEIAGIKGNEPEEAWESARRTWCSLYSDDHSEVRKVWEQMDPIVKKIYSPHDLISLAFYTPSKDITQYERPRFLKAYKELSEQAFTTLLLKAPSISAVAIEMKTCPLLLEHHE
jgi:hypothetical protein